jgi:hypothetical protein
MTKETIPMTMEMISMVKETISTTIKMMGLS